MATTNPSSSASGSERSGPDLSGAEEREAFELESPGIDSPPRALGQQARLADSLSRLRRRTRRVPSERWLLLAGSVMVPLGAILVLLGWFGAAHTGRLFEQIPYLISGGFFGLVLVVAGGFCYFGYWLARLVSDERDQSRALLDTLTRIERHLAGGPVGNGHGRAESGEERPESAAAGRPEYVATLTGSLYHDADCPVVADRPAQDLRSVRAGAKGRSPCRICLQPEEGATEVVPTSPAPRD